jgi:hypothetical protein
MTVGTLILSLIALYAAAGLCTAVAFVGFGVARVLPAPMSFTWGARLILIPGAVALWPYILVRWLRGRSRP